MGEFALQVPAVVAQAPRGDERRRLAGKPPLEVAREFEAILVTQMLSEMRKTVPDGGLGGGSRAHRVLDGAFDHEVARSLRARADLGIARQILTQIERRHGARPSAAHGAAGTTPIPGPPGAPHAVGAVPAVAGATRPAAAAPHASGAILARGVVPAPLAVPVRGRITSQFGARRDPITGAPEFHAGIDLAAPRGSAVRSVAAGEVVFSGSRRGAGNVVEVRHADDLVTSYAHVDRRLVRAGQRVAAGDVLATVGASGRATGPHLHFAVHRGGQLIDPAPILTRTAGSPATLARRAGASIEGPGGISASLRR
jgi:murein DD-endopeptidase MepM/ murein hydrolase activator NlpD